MSGPSLKSLYVSSMRALRGLARASGLLRLLDAWARRSRTGVWVRSWLSVYDVEALVADDLPWWTFEAADRVEGFLASRPGARVLEWGSGASTVWLARRGAVVTSIEHDAPWAERMRPLLARTLGDGAAVDLRVVPPVPAGTRLTRDVVVSGKRGFEGWDFADYVAEADAVAGGLDLVVIDGRAREACLSRVLARVAPGGLIVLDNVDRARYRRAVEQAGRERDLEVTWTRGRTPTLPYPTRTALLRTADA